MNKTRVSIIGGSGYAGGELLRLLLAHPNIEIAQATSRKFAGQRIGIAHPNLRGQTDLKFCTIEELEECDLLFLGLPNGISMKRMDEYMKLAPKVIDLGADFRLNNPEDYEKWYGISHTSPNLLNEFTYGIAELYRDEISKTNYVSCGGCEATCSILTLYPLLKAGIVENNTVFIDAKLGSSAAGNKPTPGSHHPERAGCVRSYKATGHRHTAEILQETNAQNIHISATAIEMVRGILITAQMILNEKMEDRDIRKIYREAYENEPFIRIIKERRGLFRYPEPKLLEGTNFCDIGFELDKYSNRLVAIGAIDNLVKGTAGQAIQAMNIMHGWDEKTALEFTGLHPI